MLLKLYFSARVRLETGLSSTNFARTATHTSSGGNLLSADCLIFGFKFSFVAIATSTTSLVAVYCGQMQPSTSLKKNSLSHLADLSRSS